MVEKYLNKQGTFLPNTGDWAEDIQPEIDFLFGLDGDSSSLSHEDLSLAEHAFCDGNANGEVSKLICGNSNLTGTTSLWKVANGIDDLRSKFSPDNPVHKHERMEAAALGEEKVREGHVFLEKVLARVKNELAKHPDLSPMEKTTLVYTVMEDLGVVFGARETLLFSQDTSELCMDCDSSSLVLMAVGYELKWPVHLVVTGRHAFVRWQDEEGGFNIDYGQHIPDQYYKDRCGIDSEYIKRGSDYFSLVHVNLKQYFKEAAEKSSTGAQELFAAAEVECRKAIALAPDFSEYHFSLCDILEEQHKYFEAEVEYRKAIELKPQVAYYYSSLGTVLAEQKRYIDAEVEYRKAVKLDPKNAERHCDLGTFLFDQKR
jgi:tetratricopeptide (TPR) repeat protein